jgi:FlaA1/EpsC-like NDP-sugar epimerase
VALYLPIDSFILIAPATLACLMGVIALRAAVTPRPAWTRSDDSGIHQLLGRAPNDDAITARELRRIFKGRSILVTGAGGSIGSELARQLAELFPGRLLLVDKDESSLFEIAAEIAENSPVEIEAVIADIRDQGRVRRILQRFRPELVFHAAAYKQVPLLESNPSEAITNNVFGSRNLIELCDELGVGTFVLISTDKAVNPASVMGASKRLAEMILQRQSQQSPGTIFCVVRFGNVLGSRGSVVPVFRKRISEGKNLLVTHPDAERYFMTVREAVMLVIQAGSMARGGEIFVLDMGRPVKIVDLAKRAIAHFGSKRDREITIEFIGLRPGEKLREEFLLKGEKSVRSLENPKIFVIQSEPSPLPALDGHLEALAKASKEDDGEAIFRILETMSLGFRGRPSAPARGSQRSAAVRKTAR